MTAPLLVPFVGGEAGQRLLERVDAVAGESLPAVPRVAVLEGRVVSPPDPHAWQLRGVVGHERYVTGPERARLSASQPPLGRDEATHAALIPVRRSADWWALREDERWTIFEERSHHIATGLRYLPGVARRLHHSRDLGEPFDFLTWFEYTPEGASAFDDLLGTLRENEEWDYVEREVDVRLKRAGKES